jgi:flagellar protein FliO/FliZ
LQTLFGLDLPLPYVYIGSLAITAMLIAIFGLVLKRFKTMTSPLGRLGGKNRQPRLGVVDTFSMDRQRQLVIIRRDNVEHLILVGGTSDLLIESNIIRSTGAAAPLPRDAQQFVKRNRTPPSVPEESTRRDSIGEFSDANRGRAVPDLSAASVDTPSSSSREPNRTPPDTLTALRRAAQTEPETGNIPRPTPSPEIPFSSPRTDTSGENSRLEPPTTTRQPDFSSKAPSKPQQATPLQQMPRVAAIPTPVPEPTANSGSSNAGGSLDDNLRRLLIRRPTTNS